MHGPIKSGATYDDLVELPENVVGEIVAGELWATPRPRVRHAAAQIQIAEQLNRRFRRGEDGPGGWWLLPEPELRLGSSVLVPDLAGWRTERLSLPDPDAAFVALAPDWVCEIVSPGTAHLDRTIKLPEYAQHDVAHAWVVDPAAHTLEVLIRRGGTWHLAAQHGGSELVRAEPFATCALALGQWWLPER